MSRVVIVGAGFGGLGCAWTFANQVSKESVSSVVVVDSKDWFTIGGTWAYAWSDRTPVAETKWPLVDAKPRLPGVELRLNTSVVSIDTAEFSYWAAVSTPPCCDYEGYQLHLNPETLHPIPYFLEP